MKELPCKAVPAALKAKCEEIILSYRINHCLHRLWPIGLEGEIPGCPLAIVCIRYWDTQAHGVGQRRRSEDRSGNGCARGGADGYATRSNQSGRAMQRAPMGGPSSPANGPLPAWRGTSLAAPPTLQRKQPQPHLAAKHIPAQL